MSNDVDVFWEATEAAKKAGAVCPEAVAEYLKDQLTVVDTMAGATVMVRSHGGFEPLGFVMSRLKIEERTGGFFSGKLNVGSMEPRMYSAIRRHRPELLGLRPKR